MINKNEEITCKFKIVETELNSYKDNKMSDNERFVEYEAKLKQHETAFNEKNEELQTLNIEKEKILKELNLLKENDFKSLQESLNSSKTENESLNQAIESSKMDFEVR